MRGRGVSTVMAMEGAFQANMHFCSWGALNYTLLHRVPKLLSPVLNSITALILLASQIGWYSNMAGRSILHEHHEFQII